MKISYTIDIGETYIYVSTYGRKLCIAVGEFSLLTFRGKRPFVIDLSNKSVENLYKIQLPVKDLCARWQITQSQLDLLTNKFLAPKIEGRERTRRIPLWLDIATNVERLKRKKVPSKSA